MCATNQLELKKGQKILYFFDYGDSHEFDVTVVHINPRSEKGKYPKIVECKGKSPPQYPDIDEEIREISWGSYNHWGQKRAS